MFVNLEQALKNKGLSVLAAAKVIDMPEPTLRTKLNGRTFTIDEAFAIHDLLFPEYDLRYLFAKAPKETEAAG